MTITLGGGKARLLACSFHARTQRPVGFVTIDEHREVEPACDSSFGEEDPELQAIASIRHYPDRAVHAFGRAFERLEFQIGRCKTRASRDRTRG